MFKVFDGSKIFDGSVHIARSRFHEEANIERRRIYNIHALCSTSFFVTLGRSVESP
jgi:hypothetical protein